jgi:hypothetical protein
MENLFPYHPPASGILNISNTFSTVGLKTILILPLLPSPELHALIMQYGH